MPNCMLPCQNTIMKRTLLEMTNHTQETFCNSQTGKVLGIFPIIGKCLEQHLPLMGNDW